MSEIIVRKVEGKKYMDDFIRVPQSIYLSALSAVCA